MKQLFLFLLMAAGMAAASCKKDKKPAPAPDYNGTPNAVSGVWSMDIYTLSSIAPFQYDYGFGTNNLYEKVTGSSTDKKTEKGSYTLTPVTGTPGAYTIHLQPVTGSAYTISVTELTETYAIFEQSQPYTKFGFRKIPRR
ncbi:hypothetical protein [Chitinophaga caseinilytica]|uniref:Lipocalin-like domain-containing protein n=1 Tax=Chitinophaga caseinilytica TaxID=2267521 RepID=A0ABZ2Z5N1_9BACT